MEVNIIRDLYDLYLLIFIAKASNIDTPNWFKATPGKNSIGFWKSMWIEITRLQNIGCWKQVCKTKNLRVISLKKGHTDGGFPLRIVHLFQKPKCY